MKIDVLTLFPEMFNSVFNESIIKRAIDNKLVEINIHNIRDFSKDPHKKVDDTPYGGGAGMVLMCQPIFDAVKALRSDNSKVILLTPSGKLYKQSIALDLSKEKHLILICGHYEGFDERIKTIVDMELSIGDYILTGGEIPAMVLIDSITRLIDGVIKKESYLNESFTDNLLDYPTYTKPRVYEGIEVPDTLVNGDHEKINKWRREMQIEITKKNRPDLLKGDDSCE
ncbi:MAG TPA: tRNA (guanosine(37)-N1)-methyltransferase TrmD [Candidatus Onthousia faecipullorum]|uniref:tRNA (guanine-N(1)-)-methyltransferase n=1 Tax=Candidatus Onthousia faecipullorum TaxID=2840887 RepID=A0A9D1GBK3_9FIRM|nr:tRNA (guanosine(37)-N1)-methyltransferase TrmD [Candidatus Onthousia faecipullorum]